MRRDEIQVSFPFSRSGGVEAKEEKPDDSEGLESNKFFSFSSFRRRTVLLLGIRCFGKIGTKTSEIRFKIFLPLSLEAVGHSPSNCEVF